MQSQLRSALFSGVAAFALTAINVELAVSKLFNNGEVGAVYDPSDLTSLYSSRTGGETFRTEERRNLLFETEDLTKALWTPTGLSRLYTAEGTVLTATAGGTHHRIINQTYTGGSGVQTYTVELSAGTHGWVQIYNGASVGYIATVDLINGIIFHQGTAATANTSATITALGGGRYRVKIVLTPSGTAINNGIWIALSPPSSIVYGATWSAVGTETVVIHNVQVENGTGSAYQRVGASFDYIGSPVGIMLDKSKMGGKTAAQFITDQSELVPNGEGDGTSLTNWATNDAQALLSLDAGRFKLENGDASEAQGRYSITLVSGQTYSVRIQIAEGFGTSGGIELENAVFQDGTNRKASTALGVSGSSGQFFIRTTSTAVQIRVVSNSATLGHYVFFDGLSVKAVPGFHSIAPSDAARPVLRLDADATIMAAQLEMIGTITPFGSPTAITNGWIIRRNSDSSILQWLQLPTITVGKRYQCIFNVANDALEVGNSVQLRQNGAPFGLTYTNQQANAVFEATSSVLQVYNLGPSHSAAVTNFSLKEIPLSAYRYYLETDGVDDWMQVLPACNLGATYSHIGGWRSDTDSRRLFTTTADHRAPGIGTLGGGLGYSVYADDGAAQPMLLTINTRMPHVLTVERANDASMQARGNGVSGSALNPFNNTGAAGLALFTDRNGSWFLGMAGRFYGGIWINRAVTESERALLETRQTSKMAA